MTLDAQANRENPFRRAFPYHRVSVDRQLIDKMRTQINKGENVIITSSLLKVREGKGSEQIADIHACGKVPTIPEQSAQLYSLPQPVLGSMGQTLLASSSAESDAPSRRLRTFRRICGKMTVATGLIQTQKAAFAEGLRSSRGTNRR